MEEPLSPDPVPPRRNLTGAIVVIVMIFLFVALHFAVDTRVQQWQTRALGAEAREVELQQRVREVEGQVASLEESARRREAELTQRERAIAGREDAATERTQSSFQGLMIQQQLMRNLEALKAAIPDLSPETEKLAKEHAQLTVQKQELEREVATLRAGR